MGHLVHASLAVIEDALEGMRYGDLEMDDVNDILLVLVKRIRDIERMASQAANTASCLANGIRPD
jgi:hypothetical protein